jgi:hypothetical protein
MPRPRKQPTPSQLSPGQAAYVVERLIAERRLSLGEVSRYVGEMGKEIDELEQRLARLRLAHGAGAIAAARRGPGRPPGRPGRPAAAAAVAGAVAATVVRRRRRRRQVELTPEQRASRQLQGRYLALVRQFAVSRRPQFSKIAKEKGREAAIKEMQNALKK